MIEFEYLYKGLCGLAHAHVAGTMAGHLGAAVAAGYFIGEDQSDLPDEVFQGITGELERVIAGEEAIWFNAKKAVVTPTQLFRPVPKEEPTPEAVPSIVDALVRDIGQTRQSGHNVIFASIALRALQDHSDFATPAMIDGIRQLTAGFHNSHPGQGYYGKDKGWLKGNQVDLPADNTFPPYQNLQEMVDVTIGELLTVGKQRRQGYGDLFHIINHAAAITELDRLGYPEVARLALPAHHQHIRLWRTLPDVEAEVGPHEKATHDPRDPVYWEGMLRRDSARLTHRIKTIYGYHAIRRFLEDDATRDKADDAFLYLMA